MRANTRFIKLWLFIAISTQYSTVYNCGKLWGYVDNTDICTLETLHFICKENILLSLPPHLLIAGLLLTVS